MIKKLEDFADSILRILDTKPEFIKIYLIPILVFVLDFSLRLFLGVDLSDIGADMALLAAAAFITIIADDKKSHHKPIVVVVFQIMFLIPWMFCLWSVSRTNQLNNTIIGNNIVDVKMVLNIISWFVGLTSLILSGVFITRIVAINPVEILEDNPNTGSHL